MNSNNEYYESNDLILTDQMPGNENFSMKSATNRKRNEPENNMYHQNE